MPWYLKFPLKPERVCRYLIQRYLGQFFEEKLALDQLSVDLYNGTGTIEKVSLDVQALNEVGEKQNWPLEFVDGYIEKLFISIPYTSILKDSSFIEVTGLKLTFQPKQRKQCATSMFESMWSSMTNSMQLAQECMKQDAVDPEDTAQPLEAIEKFAQIIDSVLSRVKVKFLDTVIQIEHVPQDSSTGVGIQINIDKMEYLDEAGNDPPTGQAPESTSQEQNKAYIVSSFTSKNFYLEGVRFSTVEFPSKARTFSRSMMSQSQSSVVQEKDREDPLTGLVQESPVDNQAESDANTSSESYDVFDERRHDVVFGKLCSRQELRIRLKQSENVAGPKVFIDVNMGPLILFLSPRQVHILLELANGLASPDTEDTSNVAPRQRCVQKPMTTSDYQRIEQDLQQQMYPLSHLQGAGLQGLKGWSTNALEDSGDDIFLPMRNTTTSSAMYESTASVASSSLDSSFTSSITSSVSDAASLRTRRRVSNMDSDPTAEISHFQIRLASLAAVILHEDVMTPSTDPDFILVQSSVHQMQNKADEFFRNISSLPLVTFSGQDYENMKADFERACPLSHIRILASRLIAEGNETTTSSAFSICGKLTIARLLVLECLNLPVMEYSTLVCFNADSAATDSPITATPNMKLAFKHVEKTGRSSFSQRSSIPKTDIAITLDKCTVEVDITIVDRICALLNPQPICVIQKPQVQMWTNPNENKFMSTPPESQVDVKVSCSSLNLKLRFPIPDFRPPHDLQRTPWWKKNVRSDYLVLMLQDAMAQTSYTTSQSFRKYSIQSQSVDIFYHETESSSPIHIAKACTDENGSTLQDVFSCCRLTIQINPVKNEEIELVEEPEKDIMTQSVYGAFINEVRDPSPFSSKRTIHESDTPHARASGETEEIIMPGDRQEIRSFIDCATEGALIQIEFYVPSVSIQLASKHIYEVLYNRINNDLLLWESSAPKPKYTETDKFIGSSNFVIENQETFGICKSGIQYNSDSESDEETDSDQPQIFHSFCDSRAKIKSQTTCQKRDQSYLVLNIHIGQGLLDINPPARDTSFNVIPGQHGELVLSVEDVQIFIVNGFKGDLDLGYVCLEAHDAQLHHCDLLSIPSQCPPLRETDGFLGSNLHPTVSKASKGALAMSRNRGGNREMISIAIRIQANHETHHVKTVRVAVGIKEACLQHRVCSEPNNWISHLHDFFNVFDYPVPGYLAKEVLTELHLHLWDCVIDYRPLNLPLRSAITLGTFTMSSHLSAQANTSTLTFIAEDCAMFLSEKAPPKSGVPSSLPIDLKKDYIMVIDFGLFELSLRTTDKKSGINPHIDLRASNNGVHIRTCADTAKALAQLITYYANDGDLLTGAELNTSGGSSFSSPRHAPEQQLVDVEPKVVTLSKSQQDRVTDLLGEAMKETASDEDDTPMVTGGGAKVFYFPDEKSGGESSKPSSQVISDLGDVTYLSNKPENDTDDEFCFLGDEPGMGRVPKNGIPEIRFLTSEPIHIIENHFAIPAKKTDMLQPPKDFPTPHMRYTLCEMSLIWHMYGGNDFKVVEKESKEKKTVNFSDPKLGDTVSYSNRDQSETVHFHKELGKSELPWNEAGGRNRNHEVLMELQLNKVRFLHEVYPKTTKQASRQVLTVADFEIRDRLASSEINKFLYQYASESLPKQTHANMLVIKATHERPDPKLQTQECCLKITLLPLRLNIDQDAMLFLIDFFSSLKGISDDAEDASYNSPKHSTPVHHAPIMSVGSPDKKKVQQEAQKVVDENLLILLEENGHSSKETPLAEAGSSTNEEFPPVYFRDVYFTSDVPIKLDYHPKRMESKHGRIAGTVMGLTVLNKSEFKLKRIRNRHGILGIDRLVKFLVQEWANDIRKNQLAGIIGSVGPIPIIVSFCNGLRDLIWLPIEQYQKDGRIVRGLQRGCNSFTTSTAMAALELTTRIIHLIQITAETAYDMLQPGPSVKKISRTKGRRKRQSQPQDIREGMANALALVKEGIGETANTIVRVASHEHEQKGYSGAIGGVLREIPSACFKPVITAAEATNYVLGGVRNQLVPDARAEANQKWRKDGDD